MSCLAHRLAVTTIKVTCRIPEIVLSWEHEAHSTEVCERAARLGKLAAQPAASSSPASIRSVSSYLLERLAFDMAITG
jgi:hypothetical protein